MSKILYYIIYPLLWLVSKLPFWWLYFKSDCLYVLAYYIFGYRKKVVMGNLELIFPEKTKVERKEIAKKFYKHLCDLVFETIKSMTISEAEIKKRMHFDNISDLDESFQKNQSILLMAGHYGNWEWNGILNKLLKHEAHAVYKPLDNNQFDSLVKNIRERFGGVIVPNKKIAGLLYRKFKKGGITLTYILSDQTPKIGAYKQTDFFMGIKVPVFTGTEEMAKALDFAVYYLKVKKVKRGYYSGTFVKLTDTPKNIPNFEVTRLFLDELEKQIQEEPAYYLWSHKRWKHRHLA